MSHSPTLQLMPAAGLTSIPVAVYLVANFISPQAEVLRRWLQLLPLIGALSCPVSSARAAPHYVFDAIADPLRSHDAQIDERRHPAELMEFASVHTDLTHRVDPQLVRTRTIAAGFIFEAESPVLRNPDDSHQHMVFNPLIRGRTDQFAYLPRPELGAGRKRLLRPKRRARTYRKQPST